MISTKETSKKGIATSVIFQKLRDREDFPISSLRFDSRPHFSVETVDLGNNARSLGRMCWEPIKLYIPWDQEFFPLQMLVQEQMQRQQQKFTYFNVGEFLKRPDSERCSNKFDLELTDWDCVLRGCFISYVDHGDFIYSNPDDIVVTLCFDHCGPLSKSPLRIECNGIQITTG